MSQTPDRARIEAEIAAVTEALLRQERHSATQAVRHHLESQGYEVRSVWAMGDSIQVMLVQRCEQCRAVLPDLDRHMCPSPRRGWYWCKCCKAWRYLNPSTVFKDELLRCPRCDTRL